MWPVSSYFWFTINNISYLIACSQQSDKTLHLKNLKYILCDNKIREPLDKYSSIHIIIIVYPYIVLPIALGNSKKITQNTRMSESNPILIRVFMNVLYGIDNLIKISWTRIWQTYIVFILFEFSKDVQKFTNFNYIIIIIECN